MKMIRMRPIISLIAAAVLFTGGGVAVGYSIGRYGNDPYLEHSSLYAQQMTARNTTTSSALGSGDPGEAEGDVNSGRNLGSEGSRDPERYRGLEEQGYDPPTDSTSPRYLLGTDHGFVAVFYVNTGTGQSQRLKERTRTPESSLSPVERERLQRGIYLYTEEQLVKALQDYGS